MGAGRVFTLTYGLFALAAGARSAVQLATHASRAPLAYTLSAAAATIYLAGALTIAAADRSPTWRRWATALCRAELTGVTTIGTLTLLRPHLFPEPTVWSHYGSGYAFVPAALPLLALWWLHRTRQLDLRPQ